MTFSLRRFAPVVLLACVGLIAGCGLNNSNNKGKIEGKWKLESYPGMEDFEKVSKETGVIMYFEFEPNGTFALGFDAENKQILDVIKAETGSTRFTAKYKLLMGDGVELSDFSAGPMSDAFKGQKLARSTVKISGDKMTMTDPDGKTGTFVKMK